MGEREGKVNEQRVKIEKEKKRIEKEEKEGKRELGRKEIDLPCNISCSYDPHFQLS